MSDNIALSLFRFSSEEDDEKEYLLIRPPQASHRQPKKNLYGRRCKEQKYLSKNREQVREVCINGITFCLFE